MKIVRLKKENQDLFLDMDPFQMMDRLAFANTFALAALRQDEAAGTDIPAGLMICSYTGSVLVVEWLCVAMNDRMHGIGEQLLTAAFEAAKKAGLALVCAYINEEYGRDVVCRRQEQYFKERLFTETRALGGEWFADLRGLSGAAFFQHRVQMGGICPLRHLSSAVVRESLERLSRMKHSAMLYPAAGESDRMDGDLSMLHIEDGQVCGGLLVQCVSRDMPQENGGRITYESKKLLYPVLFCASTPQEAHALLASALRAALEKYDADTDVHIILTDRTYTKLAEHILPGMGVENRLLCARMEDYESWEYDRQQQMLLQLG